MTNNLPQGFDEHSLWANTAESDLAVSIPDGSYNTDVLVIGGGYTGLSTALHVAMQGVSVILLEAKHFGFGGSGRNAGLVNAGVWQTPEHVEQQLGKQVGERFNRALRDSPDLVFELVRELAIDCDAERTGTINIAHKASGLAYLENRFQQLQKRGSGVKFLNADKVTGARSPM